MSETWRGARTLGDAASQHGAGSFGAHDTHETCVSHNSMRVSRRLLMWSAEVDGLGGERSGATSAASDAALSRAARAAGAAAHMVEHAEYYERTMLNAVLGTQRGTQPGAMLYMYPMGGGVSKASYTSGSELHHWGDRNTHWCCQGSGIEAFARLGDSVFWRPNAHFRASSGGEAGVAEAGAAEAAAAPATEATRGRAPPAPSALPLLFVLQLISSELAWEQQGVRIVLEADAPSSRAAGEPLTTRLRVLPHAATAPMDFLLWVRVPRWAQGASAKASGGLRVLNGSVAAGELLAVSFTSRDAPEAARAEGRGEGSNGAANAAEGRRLGGRELGRLTLTWSMGLRWERVQDDRPRFQMLQAALWGPLVLAALTHGERAVDPNATLIPVPPTAREQLVSLRPVPVPVPTNESGGVEAAASGASNGSSTPAPFDVLRTCLITRWGSVWLVHTDRTRSFLRGPSATCIERATPVADEISQWPQRDGGVGARYRLDAAESAAACDACEGCLPDGTSPFARGGLFAMHNGSGSPIVLSSQPPTVNGTRRGGTDAANAATWRLTRSPVTAGYGESVPLCKELGQLFSLSCQELLGTRRADASTLGAGGGAAAAAAASGVVGGAASELPSEAGVYLEALDLPGHVLSASMRTRAVVLRPAAPPPRLGDQSEWLQSWRLDGEPDGELTLRSALDPSLMLAVEAVRERGAPPLLLRNRGASASRTSRLILLDDRISAVSAAPSAAGQPTAPTRALASALFTLAPPVAEYPPLAMWAVPPPRSGFVRETSAFLMLPLNEVVDEHYSVYVCRVAAEEGPPPAFCR